MKFRDFLLQLTDDEFLDYAKDANTTVSYLKTHLFYGYKEPRKKLRKALALASKGKVSEAEVLQHFDLYPMKPINNLKCNISVFNGLITRE